MSSQATDAIYEQGKTLPTGNTFEPPHNEDALLAQVRAELGGELAGHGANQHGGVRDAKSTDRKDDATYVTARLRRDHPELAAVDNRR